MQVLIKSSEQHKEMRDSRQNRESDDIENVANVTRIHIPIQSNIITTTLSAIIDSYTQHCYVHNSWTKRKDERKNEIKKIFINDKYDENF